MTLNESPGAGAGGFGRGELANHPLAGEEHGAVTVDADLRAAEDVGGEEAFLEAISAAEVPDLVWLGEARRAVVDRFVGKGGEAGDDLVRVFLQCGARDGVALEGSLYEGTFLGHAKFACGVGGKCGGAVRGAEGVETLGDFGTVHFGREVERGVGTVE